MRICLSLVTQSGCGTHNIDEARFCRGCGSPLRNALQLRNVGEQVGGYTIEALVGHGGYGAVYRARGVIDGREQVVALKEALEPAAAEISAMRDARSPGQRRSGDGVCDRATAGRSAYSMRDGSARCRNSCCVLASINISNVPSPILNISLQDGSGSSWCPGAVNGTGNAIARTDVNEQRHRR
jgi:hypothetical protein